MSSQWFVVSRLSAPAPYPLLTIRYSSHPRHMPQPERQHDEADEGGDAGPVDVGLLQIADGFHQQKPRHDDERQDDDESDHAAPRSPRLHPLEM